MSNWPVLPPPRNFECSPLGIALTTTLASAVDRFFLLPEDKDFVFDFNKPQANPGKGGEIVAANRKTFPALVSTGSGIAVGRVEGKLPQQSPIF
jgi:hypothetical protein